MEFKFRKDKFLAMYKTQDFFIIQNKQKNHPRDRKLPVKHMMFVKQTSVFSLLTEKMLLELQEPPKTEEPAREQRQLLISKLDRTGRNRGVTVPNKI